ncbi:sugar porter family MFS transporter [Acetobacteraceae bacterium KSS12]|uniref:Sugar porter family MFS transporter n=2 Tax=Rhizosaccharibacter radicis TaxID=2782605 RepID=A0ABT1VYA9_9PROT|nr:sugar porter family MFS transporter [Acetobacteraceae bacterium KSS12]
MGLAACIAAICGGLYGYDTGIISGALLLITQDFHLGHAGQELVASAILAGAVVGAFATGWLSERFGRRFTVKVVTAVFMAGAACCALSPGVETLIASRLFLGLAVGGSTQVVPMYISELAPAEKRGNYVTLFNVAIGVGIVLANIIGYLMRGVWSWRTMVAVAIVPAAVVFVSMFFMPGSPRWAAENLGLERAASILHRIRPNKRAVKRELRQIEKVTSSTQGHERGWRGLGQPWVRPALVAALGVAFFTQCGGLEMMIYYAPTFLSNVGFGKSSALLASLGLAIVYAVMTTLGCIFVDRIGRRRLILVMAPGSVLSLIGLGVMFAIGAKAGIGGWLVIAFLLLFMLFNAGGIQVVGWLLGAELFPLPMRGQATSLHAATLWGSDLLVTGTALSLVQGITLGGTMWFYAGVNVLSFLFVWFLVPETAGASLEDIEDALREGRFRPSPGDVRIAGEPE